jgi:hypothetical protein
MVERFLAKLKQKLAVKVPSFKHLAPFPVEMTDGRPASRIYEDN